MLGMSKLRRSPSKADSAPKQPSPPKETGATASGTTVSNQPYNASISTFEYNKLAKMFKDQGFTHWADKIRTFWSLKDVKVKEYAIPNTPLLTLVTWINTNMSDGKFFSDLSSHLKRDGKDPLFIENKNQAGVPTEQDLCFVIGTVCNTYAQKINFPSKTDPIYDQPCVETTFYNTPNQPVRAPISIPEEYISMDDQRPPLPLPNQASKPEMYASVRNESAPVKIMSPTKIATPSVRSSGTGSFIFPSTSPIYIRQRTSSSNSDTFSLEEYLSTLQGEVLLIDGIELSDILDNISVKDLRNIESLVNDWQKKYHYVVTQDIVVSLINSVLLTKKEALYS